MIDYEKAVTTLEQLSLFEIRMLYMKIDKLLCDEIKLTKVKQKLSKGDVLEFITSEGVFMAKVEKLYNSAVVLTYLNKPNVFVTVPYDLINVDRINVDRKLFNNDFYIGCPVYYVCRSGYEHEGVITKMHGKTVVVTSDSGENIKLNYHSLKLKAT